MSEPSHTPDRTRRLVKITLDEASIRRTNPNVEHEREVAIYDLLDENVFALSGEHSDKIGPYHLHIALVEDRLAFQVMNAEGQDLMVHILALSPFRRVIRDYHTVCESYYDAIRTAPPSRIEAIDMGRRGLHDEGSRILIERLNRKIDLDHGTARRLFTLICALHWKG